MKRMGLFICHCGTNIADTVDVEELAKRFESYSGIEFSTTYKYMCSSPGQEMITDAIKEHNLDGIIVAACSPTLHELTFRKVTRKSGLNPFQCEIANVREQCSWVHKDKEKATEKALRIIRSIIEKVRLNEDLEPIKVDVTRKALVIGGGIAGMQAALDIAESGYPVILVEKEPSIGGHMAQLSETFPTLDCSQCIMTPKMVEVEQHENIKLLTYSEIEEISGYVGNFKVKIRRKSPYVDWEKCNGCGECPEACPVRLRSEFEVGLVDRTAIYRPFPQAVPNKFAIDKRGTSPCKFACPAGVNAQGYVALVSQGKFKEALALEREDNPFPSVCGRVCTHPCETECKRREVDEPVAIRAIKYFIAEYEEELPEPLLPEKKKEKVAIVGSGPSGLTCAHYLAKLGYQTTVFEALPVVGGMLVTGIPDFRLPREKLQKDINYIKSWGVDIKTNSPIKDPEQLLKDGYDAVYIATGAHMERKLGIDGEDLKGVYYGIDFLRRVNLGEKVSVGEKVAVIGGGNSAVDSARTVFRLGAKEVTIVYRRSRVEMPAYEEEIIEAEEEGIKINYLVTPTRFIGENSKLKQMECIRMELGPPDESGRRRPVPIEGSEFLIDVDTVIPTIGQIPDTSYLPIDTNLKITEKWKSFIVDEETLETSVQGIFAGGDAVLGPATIIEAVAAGKEAAISIDRFVKKLDLKEGRKKELKKVEEIEIPPHLLNIKRQEMTTLPVDERISNFREVNLGFTEEQVIKEAIRCLACGGCMECGECEKVCEPEAILHTMEDELIEEEIGAIVVATGYELYPTINLEEYGAGEIEDVIDGLAFERLLSSSGPTDGEIRRPSDGKIAKDIVFIQCAGSRDPEKHKPYCSRICCMYSTKQAMLFKHSVHEGQPYIFYIDIRSGGKGYEEFTERAQREDHVIYIRGKVSKLYRDNQKIKVVGVDTIANKTVEIDADLVVLAMAMVPTPGTKALANTLKIQVGENGFLKEAHPKLRPLESITAGYYLAGCAQGPKDIPDVVSQASGAASKVVSLFSGEYLQLEPTIATVDEELCSACRICISVCPYQAREFDDEKGIAIVNEALCESCGSCVAACPSGASSQRNLTDKQISTMAASIIKENEDS